MPETQQLQPEERTRCEIWTRVMGYHRPVASWNPGKQQEHRERRMFSESPGARTNTSDLPPSAGRASMLDGDPIGAA